MNLSAPAAGSERHDGSARPPGPAVSSQDLFGHIVFRWREGEPPDTGAALRRYPELAARRSVVLDLIFEEFCLRSEAGQSPSVGEYCRRYPDYQASLRKLLGVHGVVDEESR